ncbi:S9 family peptidase [Trichlorobacter lovleyi]|uniref:S9 family peptidase n=1 Tax=Trichlorobacter lovleyi TaxID=313985 RepID=UPI00224010B3|nr:S9 family peptidase [Trichlorobacter lovleyi]QOX79613.1 S9 family peptidase [Trichlorobacter lovleyi]
MRQSLVTHGVCNLVLLSALTGPAMAGQGVTQYDLKDFFGKPERSVFRLSEDGKTLGFMQPYERRKNLYVVSLPPDGKTPDFAKATQLTSETERDIAGFFWKGSDTILYLKDFGGDENYHLLSVDLKSGKVRDLTPFPKVRASIVDDLLDDPEHVLVQHNKRDPQFFDVYRVNVKTGDAQLVAQNPGNITGWITDHAGRVRMASTSDGVTTSLLYRATEKEPFKTILTTDFRTTVSPLFFTFDNRSLYTLSNRGRDKTALVLLDPDNGTESPPLFEHPEVDLDGLSYSHKRKLLTQVSFTTWKSQQHFFDAETRALYARLKERLPGYEIALQSENRAEDTFIVAAYNDRTQGARYVYSLKTDTLTSLGEINPRINPADMAGMQPITYTTRDGLTINGYLTVPVNREAKQLPVIVNPHGGPWVRDSWGYNPEIQFLANRGFAVFQMNYRGSTGYGRAFWEKSFKQWGRRMQDDITDGVAWLIKEGIADPKRVGIYGGSYGGYATLAGVTFTPDLYAAAVDYVGVANLFTFMQTIPPYWKPYLAMMYEMVGDPQKDTALLKQTSPVFHADRIRTPLFIAQGANDPRVNKAESDQMVAALKKRGVEVQYLVKDNEGHGFHNEENQFEFYGAMEAFFRKHLLKDRSSKK